MSQANLVPLAYVVPDFPSLYWPVHAPPGEAQYLYFWTDIWRFTLYWTLISIGAAHFFVAVWAVLMQLLSAYRRRKYLAGPAGQRLSAKNRRLLGENPFALTLMWAWVIPTGYLVMGCLEAVLAGSLVGLVLGAIYNAGYFKMSTLTPLVWGIINMLVLIVSSFRVQGGL